MMRTQPRFVTPSDFVNYTGIDLSEKFKSENNESNKANLFLMQIEDTLLARIDNMSFRNVRWENLSDLQLENLQKAIIYQAEYILRNGDLFTDSGYDLERGEIISFDKLQKISICRVSIDLLKNCGLLNHVIINKTRILDYR